MTKTVKRVNLPWVEKYRPSTLDDLVSHEDIIKTVSKFIKEDQVPHLLFYGPPGTGKTSTILACARQLYTSAQFSTMVLELNASDDRGIGIVRGQILTFASTRTIFKSGFKLIILDEADAMTLDAQNALRRIFNGHSVAYKRNNLGHTGQSSIIRRFCYNEFSRSYVQTVGSEFYIKHLLLPSRKEITVRITDVGGSELKGTMLDKYLYNTNIIVLVYDITSINSFEDLTFWVDAITSAMKAPPIVAIVGNRCDLEYQRTVSNRRVNKFAREMNILQYVVSAKTGESVSSSVVDMIAKYVGIPLTKVEKERQIPIIKAELVPAVPNEIPKKAMVVNGIGRSNTSICSIQ